MTRAHETHQHQVLNSNKNLLYTYNKDYISIAYYKLVLFTISLFVFSIITPTYYMDVWTNQLNSTIIFVIDIVVMEACEHRTISS